MHRYVAATPHTSARRSVHSMSTADLAMQASLQKLRKDQAMNAALEKLNKDNDTYRKARNTHNESALIASMGSYATALRGVGLREKAEKIEASRRLFKNSWAWRKRVICQALSETIVRICGRGRINLAATAQTPTTYVCRTLSCRSWYRNWWLFGNTDISIRRDQLQNVTNPRSL